MTLTILSHPRRGGVQSHRVLVQTGIVFPYPFVLAIGAIH